MRIRDMDRDRIIRVAFRLGIVLVLVIGFVVVYGEMMKSCGGCGCGCEYIG